MADWVRELHELTERGEPFAMATVIRCEGSTPREPGARMFVLEDGTIRGTIGGGQLEARACADALAALASGEPRSVIYPLCSRTGQCCGGRVEMWFEPVNCGPSLYVFGAGHVGQAVARVLAGTPFRVAVVDEREEWLNAPGLPAGVRRFKDWRACVEGVRWSAEQSYAVVMTHSHDLDLEIVRRLLDEETRYLGLIGSRTKWNRFQEKLRYLGVEEWEWEKVNCPIGLPIGGKSPQEVAISLSAQLLKDHHSRLTARTGAHQARKDSRKEAEPVWIDESPEPSGFPSLSGAPSVSAEGMTSGNP